jgi:hypothetical protein
MKLAVFILVALCAQVRGGEVRILKQAWECKKFSCQTTAEATCAKSADQRYECEWPLTPSDYSYGTGCKCEAPAATTTGAPTTTTAGTTTTSAPRTKVTAGGDCTSTAGALKYCEENYTCKHDMYSTDHSKNYCIHKYQREFGDACDHHADCFSMTCTSGRCAMRADKRQLVNSNECAPTYYPSNQKCVEMKPDDCVANANQCTVGYYCNATSKACVEGQTILTAATYTDEHECYYGHDDTTKKCRARSDFSKIGAVCDSDATCRVSAYYPNPPVCACDRATGTGKCAYATWPDAWDDAAATTGMSNVRALGKKCNTYSLLAYHPGWAKHKRCAEYESTDMFSLACESYALPDGEAIMVKNIQDVVSDIPSSCYSRTKAENLEGYTNRCSAAFHGVSFNPTAIVILGVVALLGFMRV